MDILVTYDIGDTQDKGAKRLKKISDLCCEYGERVQFSVFECRLTPARFVILKSELENLIDPKQDSVNIYRFAGPIKESKTVIGIPSCHDIGETWIL